MKTIQRMFELNLTPKEVVWGKRILAVVILPVLVFYTTSMNFIFLGMMNAQAADTATVQTDNSASTPSLANTTSEPDKKVDSSSVDTGAYKAALAKIHETDYTTDSWTTYQKVVKDNEVTGDDAQKDVDAATKNIQAAQADLIKVSDLTDYKKALSVVSEKDYTADSWTIYQATVSANVVTDQDAQKDVDTATDKIKKAQDDLIKVATTNETTAPTVEEQGTITPQAASTKKVAVENPLVKPEWVNSNGGKNATIGPVEQGVTYKAPQNNKVTVTFTKLPEKAGNLTIKEIKLSSEEQLAIGALSDTAYDIASDMDNGTFKYDLTLPYPDKDNDGKAETASGEVKASDLQVLYTEENEVKKDELKNVEEDKSVGKDTNKSGKVIELKGLDHFTIFVVTATGLVDGTASGDFCTTESAGGIFTCYNSLQSAINAAPSGNIIIVNKDVTEDITVPRSLIFELNKDITITGAFTVNSSVILTLKQHSSGSGGTYDINKLIVTGIFTNKGTVSNSSGDGDIDITSGGNLYARTITSTSIGNVSLTSTSGSILDETTASQSTYITGTNITLSAPAGSIGAYDATISTISNFNKGVDVKLNGGILNATAKDDVAVTEVIDLDINSSNYTLTSNTAGKYVIFGNMKAGGTMTINSAFDSDALIRLVSDGAMTVDNAISTSASDLELYSKGNITLNKSLTAGTNAVVKAGFSSGTGSIIDDGKQDTTISATNITLNANGGSVSNVTPDVGNGTINFLNAVDVALGAGGTLTTNGGYVTETGGDKTGRTYTLGGGNLSLSKAFSGASSLVSPDGNLVINANEGGIVLIGEYSETIGSEPVGVKLFGKYYDIQHTGTLSGSATITMTYDPAQVTGLTEDQINGIYHYNGGNWTRFDNPNSVDKGTNTITLTASDFSTPIVAGGDVAAPNLTQTTPVPTLTNSNTPSYTFTSNEAGTISYAGGCSSTTVNAIAGVNTIVFGTLGEGLHNTCTITVTDAYSNVSAPLAVNSFTVDTLAPTYSISNGTESGPVQSDVINVSVADATSVVSAQYYGFSSNDTCDSGDTISTSFTNGSNFTISNDHTDYLCVKAVDSASNTSYQYIGHLNTDNTAALVANVTSTKANGYYKVGEVIDITATFNEIVNVNTTGGTPTVLLETGTTDRTVAYASGSGSNTLVFNYTIQAGDTSADLDYTGTSALALNGGIVRDVATNNANLALATPGAANSLGNNKAIVVDTTNPTGSTDILSTGSDTPFITGSYHDDGEVFSVSVTIAGHTYVADLNYGGVLGTWGVQVTDVLSEGLHSVLTSVMDFAGNIGNNTTADAVSVDTGAPSLVKFSSTSDNGVYGKNATINITAEYSEDLEEHSNLTVTLNTTPSQSVTLSTVSGHNISGTYTVQNEDSAADLTVSAITHEDVNDLASNRRTNSNLSLPTGTDNIGGSKNIVVDGVAPTIILSTTSEASTKVSPILVTAQFSETVTEFTIDDFTVVNGTKSNFVPVDGDTYTIDVAPIIDGVVTIDVNAAVAKDSANNDNTAAVQLSRAYDTLVPTLFETTPIADPVSDNTPDYTFNSSEAGNIIYGGDCSSGTTVAVAGGNTVTLNALSEGTHSSCTIVVTDAAGNPSSALKVSSFRVDVSSPTVALSTPAPNPTNANFTVTAQFSETVTEFTIDDFTVVNGTKSNFVPVDGDTYTIDVAPIIDGVVTIDVNAAVAKDSANNDNTAAVQLSRAYDHTAPTVVITSLQEGGVAVGNLTIETSGVTGANVCTYKIDSETEQTIVCNATIISVASLEGNHTLTFYGRDNAGNEAFDSIGFIANNDQKLTVGASGKDFTSIQTAINNATNGDTIEVSSGTYTENVQIFSKDGLTITGVGDGTLITGSGYGIEIDNSDNITIKDLKIVTNGPDLHGIYVDGDWVTGRGISTSVNLTIQNTTISASGTSGHEATGIYADYVTAGANTGWNITGNRITADGGGIGLEDVTDSKITGNTITITNGTNILWLAVKSDLTNLEVSDNTVNGSGGSQISFLTDYHTGSAGKTITGVTFHGNMADTYGSRALRIGTGVSGVVADHNKFLDADKSAILNESATSVNAESNWWGTAVKSTIQSLVSDAVDFEPYYVNEAMTKLSDEAMDTVYVDDSYSDGHADTYIFGYDAFAKIQDGIDKVSSDGTVNVAAGTYTEQVTINKSLDLIGAGEADTTILAPAVRAGSVVHNGTTHDYLLAAYAPGGTIDVRIQGFTLNVNGQNKTSGAQMDGVFFDDVSGVNTGLFASTIHNFAATEYEGFGVVVYGNSLLTLNDNNISDYTRDGISINRNGGSSSNPNVTISNNTITGSATPLNGINIDTVSAGSVTGNTVTGNTRSAPWAAGGIVVWTSSGMTISGNHVDGNFYGINLQDNSHDITVSGNDLTDNIKRGITVDNSDNNTVSGNMISGLTIGTFDTAIGLVNTSTGNTVGGAASADKNTITMATSGTGNLYAIHVQGDVGTGNNTIQNNTINGGKRAVQVDGGNTGLTTILNNTITNTGGDNFGVGINGGSATISGNTLTNTVRPIEFWGAINVTISGNTINGSVYDGINAGSASGAVKINGDNKIYNIANNQYGIHVQSGVKNIEIDGNEIYSSYTGIGIDTGATGSIITDNNIHNNSFSGITANEALTTVTGNTVDNDWRGIETSKALTANNNKFTNNAYGSVIFHSGDSHDVTHNWWGTKQQSGVIASVVANGNAYTYAPWYLDEAMIILSSTDTTGPTVVLSDDLSGRTRVKAGNIVNITATLSDINGLASGVTPTISIFGTAVSGAAMDGSGNVWTYVWTVPDGKTTANVSVTAQDAIGNEVSATTGTTSYTIDNSAATVSSADITTADGTYDADDNIDITVNYLEAVTITGSPRIQLNVVGSAIRYATYSSGSGGTAIVFRYTVQAGDNIGDLGALNVDALGLNSGTIKDVAGKDAINTLLDDLTAANAVVIDTTAPTLTTTTIASDNSNHDYARTGSVVTLTIGSSENIQTPTVTIAGHSIVPTGSNSAWSAVYTMLDGDTQGGVPFSINYSDLVGSAGATVTTVTAGSDVTFDKTAPTKDYRTAQGKWFLSNPNLDINFSDNSMLEKVEYRLNNSGDWRTVTDTDAASYTTDWKITPDDWSSMPQADNTYIYFRITDKAGNVYTTPDDKTFLLRKDAHDPDAPTYHNEGTTYTSNPTLNIDFSDDGSLDKIEYKLNSGGTYQTLINHVHRMTRTTDWSMNVDIWANLSAGPNYIYFRITDEAGNEYETVSDGAGFLFYKNSGSGGVMTGTVEGAQNNGGASPKGTASQGAESTPTPQVLGEESPTGGEQATGAPAPEGAQNPWRQAIPYALGGTLLLSGIWLWLKRRGGGVGGSTPTILGMMFSSLKTAASKIRMFLW